MDYPFALRGNGLAGWWRGDRVSLTGGLVDAGDDLSGKGQTAIGSGATRPEMFEESFLFAGSEYLVLPESFADALGITAHTWWCVHAPDDAGVAAAVLRIGGEAGGQALTLESGDRRIRLLSVGTVDDGPASVDGELVVVTRLGGEYRMFVNNVRVALASANAVPFAAGGASIVGALTTALVFGYSGLIGEWGGVSRALAGGNVSVGSPCTDELARLAAYVSRRYLISM